jgi:hypothetical protein
LKLHFKSLAVRWVVEAPMVIRDPPLLPTLSQ